MTTTTKVKLEQLKSGASLEQWNACFTPLTFSQRLQALYTLHACSEVLVTSSFGASSAFLLYWLSRIAPEQKIYFIDTGYHFPETLEYKQQLSERYKLRVEDVRPEARQHAGTRREKTWKSDPDRCCYINKLQPLEKVKPGHKVWISGLMGWQNPHRAGLRVFERQGDLLKFHPLVDIDEGEYLYYQSYLDLPEHPLVPYGYGSIGCMHCTVQGDGREGRWQGRSKSECGLHTGYFDR